MPAPDRHRQGQDSLDNVVQLKAPPYNTLAEMTLLGVMLMSATTIDPVLEGCGPEDMYHGKHKVIFESIVALHTAGEAADMVTVAEHLMMRGEMEQIGLSYLSTLADHIPSVANARYYTQIIRDLSDARELLRVALATADKIYRRDWESVNELIDDTERDVFAINDRRTKEGEGLVNVASVAKELFEEINDAYHGKPGSTGISTGIETFDEIASLVDGDLILLGGRPSMGKTATALQVMANAAINEGKNIAFFSGEMNKKKILRRLLATVARVSGNRLAGREKLIESDIPKLTRAVMDLKELGIYVDDKPKPTISYMRSKLNRLRAELSREGKGDVDLVVVDYIQIMGDCLTEGKSNREREISERSIGLKGIAQDYEVPVVALSQLNRELERRPDKRPIMSDLRESGSLEQDSDLVVFVYRDEVYHEDTDDRGVVELIVGKHRDGPIGTARARFTKEIGAIEDLPKESDYR